VVGSIVIVRASAMPVVSFLRGVVAEYAMDDDMADKRKLAAEQ
jgi:hypothetical protein